MYRELTAFVFLSFFRYCRPLGIQKHREWIDPTTITPTTRTRTIFTCPYMTRTTPIHTPTDMVSLRSFFLCIYSGFFIHKGSVPLGVEDIQFFFFAPIVPSDSAIYSEILQFVNDNVAPAGIRLPMTPEQATKYYGSKLTEFERAEIEKYSEIWYLGLSACKIHGEEGASQNGGYDDDNGSYNKVLHDHISYR